MRLERDGNVFVVAQSVEQRDCFSRPDDRRLRLFDRFICLRDEESEKGQEILVA